MVNQYKFGRTILYSKDISNISMNGNGYDFKKVIVIYLSILVFMCMIIISYIIVYECRIITL